MKKNPTTQMVRFAMFASLTAVMTLLFRIPIPNGQGYLNIGDAVLLLAALLMGPAAGFWVGAIGSTLADMIAGYAMYMPFTFVVKGVEGLLAGALYKRTHTLSLSVFLPALWMAGGYFLTDWFLYGLAAALAAILMNLLQGILGAVLAVVLFKILNPIFSKRTP
ncbi:Thiamine precursor transporter HmpT [Jeotgalibaca dankookensis]|uniref:Thiamine transporter HmpT n=1 Tax=Jeotgalibaca dankookensis TaxID=708126 RepID=A0A1S6IQF7_9LACT|nr:ECF transporter S component [Jeotgalibaca dankookensis]AQS53710.1 Thiamine precursor transporter HmpT [Jeotgalibaca dankookensis]